jgi:hypothetical protein
MLQVIAILITLIITYTHTKSLSLSDSVGLPIKFMKKLKHEFKWAKSPKWTVIK